VVVAAASAGGDLRLFPAGAPPPPTSAINFARSQTRTNNAILALGAGGRFAAWCDLAAGLTGTVQLVVDVTGYFE
jgi:hypothetical protein